MDKDGQNKSYRINILITVCLLLCTDGLLRCEGYKYSSEVQWTAALRLYEYNGFHSVSVLNYIIPTSSAEAYFEFRGGSITKSCPERHVNIYIQHGSFPVISPYNESFPDHFYLNRTDLRHVVVQTNNNSLSMSIKNPKPGVWFLGAFIPKSGEKISQKGLNKKNCLYGLNIEVVSTIQEDVIEMSVENSVKVRLSDLQPQRMLRYIPPEGTYKYTVIIDECSLVYGSNITNTTSCPFNIDVSMEMLPTEKSLSTISQDCSNTSLPCLIDVYNPVIMKWNYLQIGTGAKFENLTYIDLNLKFDVKKCTLNLFSIDSKSSEVEEVTVDTSPLQGSYTNYTEAARRQSSTKEQCLLLMGLGRLNFARDYFSSLYVFSDAHYGPLPDSLIFVPDTLVLAVFLTLDSASDSGGTFKVAIETTKAFTESTQDATVMFCMMKNVIPNLSTVEACPGGISIKVNTTSKDALSSKLYIPYPEEGRWYIGLHSKCYKRNNTGLEEHCKHFPAIKIHLAMTKCVDEGCGQFGECQETISGLLVFSSCKCYAGWRGYGCTDGTEAESDTEMLTSTLLLTLSNLLFIPGIILAVYRRYFVEALVYTYTMFFSTFYHACDTNAVVHHYCMMKYDVLSYCDFLGSIMSFWVTILAMARLKDGIRSFFHMLGALCLALGVEYDRHGLWVFVVPAVTGVVIMFISWAIQCHKRKTCYPTKWRYLKFLLPGVLLAGTGLVIFAFLETEDNYKYTHSAWHIVMALCIIFLLPSRQNKNKGKKWYMKEGKSEEVASMIQNAADGDDEDNRDFEEDGIPGQSINSGHVEPISDGARNIIL